MAVPVMQKEVRLTLEVDREEDGRWIGAVPEIPGCLVYGATREEAGKGAITFALRVVADRVEHGEMRAEPFQLTFQVTPAMGAAPPNGMPRRPEESGDEELDEGEPPAPSKEDIEESLKAFGSFKGSDLRERVHAARKTPWIVND